MRMRKVLLGLGITGVLFAGSMTGLSASGGGGNNDMNFGPTASKLYQQGVTADKAGDYTNALKFFQQALDKDGNNPEYWNMFAHTQRMLGMIDESLDNYKKALKIKPDFADAREYLGEAYIQAALREIKILKGYGKNGQEQLEDLTKALKQAAASVK